MLTGLRQGGGEAFRFPPLFIRPFSAYSKIWGKALSPVYFRLFFCASFPSFVQIRTKISRLFPPRIFNFSPQEKNCLGFVFFLGFIFLPTEEIIFPSEFHICSVVFTKIFFDRLEEKPLV